MKKTYVLFLLILVATFCLKSNAQSEWKTLKTGACGWITGMDINPSGNPVLIRSDVGGAYRLNPNNDEWVQIVNAESMPVNEVNYQNYAGVLSIVSAPTDANRLYMAYLQGIYTSNNQGENWTKTNFPEMVMEANIGDAKYGGERLAVDPINASLVYFGSEYEGLWRSEDAGLTWAQIANIPINSDTIGTGVRQVLFDTSSGTTAGKTNRLLVTVDNYGVFESTDAGQTWVNTNVGVNQVIFLDAEISNNGQLYVCGQDLNGNSFGVRRYDGNTWSEIFYDGLTTGEIALDPFDSDRAVIMSNGFSDTYVTNNLSSSNPNWSYKTSNREGNNLFLMAWNESNWYSLGEVLFDPVVNNRLWISLIIIQEQKHFQIFQETWLIGF